MIIRVSFKDPDALYESVGDAIRKLPKPDGLSDSEWKTVKKQREETEREKIADKWMQYSEYHEIDFDTDAGTATVVPAKR